MKYYTTKKPLKSKRKLHGIVLFFIFCIVIIGIYFVWSMIYYSRNTNKVVEFEYVPNEIDGDTNLLEPLSSETSFPGGMPAFLQKTRHDPEVLNIQDNLDKPNSVKN